MAVDTEKVYDCLIIGATFAAMGISAVLNEKCLIAERGLLAGYEFFNALNFGENYESPLRNEQSHELLKAFEEKGVFESGEIRLERAVSAYYSLLKNKNVLMNTSVVSKRKNGDIFSTEIFGASGFRTVHSKKIIDTTIIGSNIESIFFNIITVDGKVKLPVKENNYTVARAAVDAFLKTSGKKLLYSADCMEYKAKRNFYAENDIVYIPSCAFENPISAFDCAVTYAKTGDIK